MAINTDISYSKFEESDFDLMLSMALKLWPDFEQKELRQLLKETTQSNTKAVWIAKANDHYAGFSIFSIRTDYVEGAEKSPTGYLEGIFVEPNFRKNGIANSFVQLGQQWCKEHGCTQMGSDTWLNNTESREFHKRMGFREEEELVHFLKNI